MSLFHTLELDVFSQAEPSSDLAVRLTVVISYNPTASGLPDWTLDSIVNQDTGLEISLRDLTPDETSELTLLIRRFLVTVPNLTAGDLLDDEMESRLDFSRDES